MSDPQGSASKFLWGIVILFPALGSLCVLLGYAWVYILQPINTRISSEVRDENIVNYSAPHEYVSIQPRKSPTPVELVICRAINPGALPGDDYHVHFRTQENVTFINRGGKFVALARVDLTGKWRSPLPLDLDAKVDNAIHWQVETFELNRTLSLPTYIDPITSKAWRFVGTLTIGKDSETLARQAAEELRQSLEALTWKLILEDGTSIEVKTIPTVIAPGPATDCPRSEPTSDK